MLYPSLSKAKVISRRATCRSNLHGIGTAFQMYLNGSNDLMPEAAPMPSQSLSGEPAIADVLAKEIESPELLRCPADTEKNFFATERTSYWYNTMLGGRKADEGFLAEHLGAEFVPVMHDFEPFHGPAGKTGSMNYLFADMHVGDLVE
jgi:hypothetical protein